MRRWWFCGELVFLVCLIALMEAPRLNSGDSARAPHQIQDGPARADIAFEFARAANELIGAGGVCAVSRANFAHLAAFHCRSSGIERLEIGFCGAWTKGTCKTRARSLPESTGLLVLAQSESSASPIVFER